jgi:hypothetical protein
MPPNPYPVPDHVIDRLRALDQNSDLPVEQDLDGEVFDSGLATFIMTKGADGTPAIFKFLEVNDAGREVLDGTAG